MIIRQNKPLKLFLLMLSAAVIVSFIPQQADARRTRTSVHRSSHTSVHRSTNVHRNRNTNVNVRRNTNVNVNRHVDVNVNNRRGRYYHPVATGVAIGATAAVTAAVIGSVVNTLPPSGCTTVIRNGIAYSQCGSVWYEPRYSGNNVSYVVVNPM